MGLTRQERVAQYMVGYHQHIQPTKPESSKSATPKTPSTASRNPSGAPKTPSSTSRTPSALQKPSTTPKIPSSARKTASAASKTPFSTPKNQSTSNNTPSSSSAASPSTPASSSARKRSLPSGWKSEVRTKDGKEITIYISENGEEMPVNLVKYMAEQQKSMIRAYQSSKWIKVPFYLKLNLLYCLIVLIFEVIDSPLYIYLLLFGHICQDQTHERSSCEVL